MAGLAPDTYWQLPPEALLATLQSSSSGLASAEAAARLRLYGPNAPARQRRASGLRLALRQFRSPLVLILLVAALIAMLVADWLDSAIILVIVLGSALLSFGQERRANQAMEALRRRVTVKATVLRDGAPTEIAVEEVVPGDVVLLNAGDLIPGDGVLLAARDLFLSQAVLTGETFPVEKQPGLPAADAGLEARSNCVFMGTHVRSGTGTAVIARTGQATAFGAIAERLSLRPPETEFERGVRHFGYLLGQVVLGLVLVVLMINVFLARPPVDALLFALALAVGMSPEMLPALVSITLAHGARSMAAQGVIVRQLNAIENLGSMGILCTDKTGTITEGVVRLDAAQNAQGEPTPAVLRLAFFNAILETGLSSPLDDAILEAGRMQGLAETPAKLDEIPYDFMRKRVSIVIAADDEEALLVTKGALEPLLDICADLNDSDRTTLLQRYRDWSVEGFRVLGVASRRLPRRDVFTAADELGVSFQGFLLFFDPPKADIAAALADLTRLGVQLKIITGDNRFVAVSLAQRIGLANPVVLSGSELGHVDDAALWHKAVHTDLFVEVDPNQKERIIRALRTSGQVVGYMGDGINDAPALMAADVGISVDTAVDVAKEAADLVLLERDLGVLSRGIAQGRATFANTMKFIFTVTSANFGNMISMALASAFLPFLPLLAKQILLNNFLSDIPVMSIAGDKVDEEWQRSPHRWDVRLIRNFMLTFGLSSTLFDMLTFALLLLVVGANPELFRTGWFVESLLTELLILFVIRTYKPFYRSRPGRLLLWSSLAMMALALLLPYLPGAGLFEFQPLPPLVLLAILAISLLYVLVSELLKRRLYRSLR
jgi:Mg2+-importing ATPase